MGKVINVDFGKREAIMPTTFYSPWLTVNNNVGDSDYSHVRIRLYKSIGYNFYQMSFGVNPDELGQPRQWYQGNPVKKGNKTMLYQNLYEALLIKGVDIEEFNRLARRV